MNVSIGFPTVFFFSFGLTPPGYLAFFYCSTHRNVLTGHRICFFLLFFLASIVSIGLPVRPALLSLRLRLDSAFAHYQSAITSWSYEASVCFFSFFLLPSSVSPPFLNHFGSFWLNSHDFCSPFHFIFSLPSRVYSRKIPKTRLRDFFSRLFRSDHFLVLLLKIRIHFYSFSALQLLRVTPSILFLSLSFSRVFFRAFPRSHFLLSSLRLLLSSSVSAHLTHSDLTI